jgi:hypothetical protein
MFCHNIIKITEDPYHTVIVNYKLHKIQTLTCSMSWKIKSIYLYSDIFQKISAIQTANNRGISPGHEEILKSGTKSVKR